MPDTKLCECGCGEPAPIAKRTYTKDGHVKGQPTRFVKGHGNRGRKFTAEWRRNLSRACQGKRYSLEHRQAIGDAMRGEQNHRWKGGSNIEPSSGYVRLANGGRSGILEHRAVMQRIIGRPFRRGEHVHHVNEARADNRPENLWLFPDTAAHTHWHLMVRTGCELARPMAAVALGDGA